MVLRSSMVHIIIFRGMFNTHILCLWLIVKKNIYLNSKSIITEKKLWQRDGKNEKENFGHVSILQGLLIYTTFYTKLYYINTFLAFCFKRCTRLMMFYTLDKENYCIFKKYNLKKYDNSIWSFITLYFFLIFFWRCINIIVIPI